MPQESDIGLDACSEMPCFFSASPEEHGRHGVAIHNGKAVKGGFDKETSVPVAIQGNPDQLAGFSLWKCTDQGVL
jgi:hypothetical protein